GDVELMAKSRVWPSSLGTPVIAEAVYRMTGGHPAATSLILQDLEIRPELTDDLDQILRRTAPGGEGRVEDYLVDQIVAGLSPHQRVDPQLRQDRMTLSAARDRAEARELKTLVETPEDTEPVLFASTTLWSDIGPRKHPILAPFVRYLLLRALADRPEDHPKRWQVVFEQLRKRAADLAGRLHHDLALDGQASVIAELAELLPGTGGAQWLSLLDQLVATPDPRSTARRAGNATKAAVSPADQMTRLVTELHAVSDPQLSDRTALHRSYRRI